MLLKRAEPVGHCGAGELRDLLCHIQCIQSVPPAHAKCAWKHWESLSH